MSENQDANNSNAQNSARNSARNFRKEQEIRIKSDPRMFMVSPEFWKKPDKPVKAEYSYSIEDR